ncbi:MAG: hypothetical protein V8R91_21515 [Butyricimonas faecihominis]
MLPQGDASDEANARIQDIFDTYGSYVLYNYTYKDAFWTQTSAGVPESQVYVAKMGETRYVDAMLDYIHDIWLQFFPDDFLKKRRNALPGLFGRFNLFGSRLGYGMFAIISELMVMRSLLEG